MTSRCLCGATVTAPTCHSKEEGFDPRSEEIIYEKQVVITKYEGKMYVELQFRCKANQVR